MLWSLAVLNDDQSAALAAIVQWATDFLAWMLPLLPYVMGIVLIFALLYKFTLGAVKRL